jgi:hypothetical protein
MLQQKCHILNSLFLMGIIKILPAQARIRNVEKRAISVGSPTVDALPNLVGADRVRGRQTATPNDTAEGMTL